jgi:hypothetical protein
MKHLKNFLLLKLIFTLIFFSQLTSALAPTPADAAYWNMNNALSGIVKSATEKRGYVPSDPRTYGTLQGISGAATASLGAAAGSALGLVTVGAVTAPAWASVALFAGVSSIVGYAVTLGLNGLQKWLFRSDNKLDTAQASTAATNLVAGQPCYYVAGTSSICTTSQDTAYVSFYLANSVFTSFTELTITPRPSDWAITGKGYRSDVAGIWTSPLNYAYARAATVTCPPGYGEKTNACVSLAASIAALPSTATGSFSGQTLTTAVNAIPATDLQRPLNPELVAALANALWQRAAAQPGYQGLPYPQSNPITPAEALAFQQANPANWPTVENFVQPRQTTVSNVVSLPSSVPSSTSTPTSFTTSPNPSTVNPSTQTLINLGADPAIPPPTLEPTPTASQILAPILNLMPTLRAFQVSSHSAICPKPSLSLLGKTFVMESHCTLIDTIKPILQAAMNFGWAAIALFIILSA